MCDYAFKASFDRPRGFDRERNAWSGIKNGKLMTLCVEHGFDILLTIDKNLQYQQNLDKHPVIIVVLNSFTSKVEDLIMLLPTFRTLLPIFEKHKVYVIDK